MDDTLLNEKRNKEVEATINRITIIHSGSEANIHFVASALATLDMAESTQILAVKIEESFAENERSIRKAFDALIQSNENVARSNEKLSYQMIYMTGGLIFVGFLSALVPIIMFFISRATTVMK